MVPPPATGRPFGSNHARHGRVDALVGQLVQVSRPSLPRVGAKRDQKRKRAASLRRFHTLVSWTPRPKLALDAKRIWCQRPWGVDDARATADDADVLVMINKNVSSAAPSPCVFVWQIASRCHIWHNHSTRRSSHDC